MAEEGWADKFVELGATEAELAEIAAADLSEDELCILRLCFLRMDRTGVIASQKKRRSSQRKRLYYASPSHRIRSAMTTRIWAALKGRTDGALFSRLAYSQEELVAHLENQFRDGMTWSNYGKWHVDHIKPCAAFDQTDREQFMECWSLANLTPLWASENMAKGAKYGAA